MNKQQVPLTASQNNSLAALVTQMSWFSGYFNRQAQRVLEEPANER